MEVTYTGDFHVIPLRKRNGLGGGYESVYMEPSENITTRMFFKNQVGSKVLAVCSFLCDRNGVSLRLAEISIIAW